MKRVSTLIIALVFLMSVLVGCGNAQSSMPPVKTVPESESASASESEPLSEYASAYVEILQENRENIKQYDWSESASSQMEKQVGTVVIEDVLGDKTPELIYLAISDENEWSAQLFIWTYADGAARLVLEQEDFDVEAGMGVGYGLFTLADGTFYICQFSGEVQENYVYTSYDYLDGYLKAAHELTCQLMLTEGYDPEFNYRFDDSEISEAEYIKHEDDIFPNIDKMLIKNMWYPEIELPPVRDMSFEDAMALLIPVDLVINGIPIETEVAPFRQGGQTFIPLMTVAKALSCDAEWNEKKGTVIIKNERMEKLEFVPESLSVLRDDELMVPDGAIGAYFKGYTKWEQGYSENSTLKIYSEYPVKTKSGIGIASYWQTDSEELPIDPDLEIEWGDDLPMAVLEDFAPQYFGFPDALKQTDINSNNMNSVVQGAEEYNGYLTDLTDAEEYSYEVSHSLDYSYMGEEQGVLQVELSGYSYWGGAHGMYEVTHDLYDVKQTKKLTLGDIFVNETVASGDAEDALFRGIDVVLKNGTPEYLPEDNEGVSRPEGIDFEYQDFYFSDGELILVYQVYELASYARGLVEFPIPMENLSKLLKPVYKDIRFDSNAKVL